MTEERIGKINGAWFGGGGYQDAMIGIGFDLGGAGWGVGDFWGDWALERSDYAKWTDEERITRLGKMVMRLNALLHDAKAKTVSDLKGKPIMVTFEGNMLKSWRILTEAL